MCFPCSSKSDLVTASQQQLYQPWHAPAQGCSHLFRKKFQCPEGVKVFNFWRKHPQETHILRKPKSCTMVGTDNSCLVVQLDELGILTLDNRCNNMYWAVTLSFPRTAVRCPSRASLSSFTAFDFNCDHNKKISSQRGYQNKQTEELGEGWLLSRSTDRGIDQVQVNGAYLKCRTNWKKITNCKLPVYKTVKPRYLQ